MLGIPGIFGNPTLPPQRCFHSVRVDRATWRCGGNASNLQSKYGPTRMLNPQGMMCCIGFACNQSGVSREELFGESVIPDGASNIEWLYILSIDAYRINDNSLESNEMREDELREHFAQYGHHIEFVGEYPE